MWSPFGHARDLQLCKLGPAGHTASSEALSPAAPESEEETMQDRVSVAALSREHVVPPVLPPRWVRSENSLCNSPNPSERYLLSKKCGKILDRTVFFIFKYSPNLYSLKRIM